jgi:hypothetical protein
LFFISSQSFFNLSSSTKLVLFFSLSANLVKKYWKFIFVHFFNNSTNISVSELITGDSDPGGLIYTQYYNLLKEPIDNFFTLSERGLSSSANQIDPKLKSNPGAAEKKENGKSYWICLRFE